MSEQQQRIERWVNVYPGGEGLECYTREEADRDQDAGRVRCARLVEIREGEPHPDEAAKTIAALTERAEKAEAALKWHQDEFGAVHADERARFERECAMRMLAALWGSDWNGDADDATERIIVRAAKLADHYFGAKEAK